MLAISIIGIQTADILGTFIGNLPFYELTDTHPLVYECPFFTVRRRQVPKTAEEDIRLPETARQCAIF
jgi:hypothetical protein